MSSGIVVTYGLTCICGVTFSASARRWGGDWFDSHPKQCHSHEQLGLPDKGGTIKGLVVCYVAWQGSILYWMGLGLSKKRVGCLLCSMPRIYVLWDGSFEKRKVRVASIYVLWDGQVAWSGPLVWSGWLQSSSTATGNTP